MEGWDLGVFVVPCRTLYYSLEVYQSSRLLLLFLLVRIEALTDKSFLLQ